MIITGSTRGESEPFLSDPLDEDFLSLSAARVYDSLRDLGFQPENMRVLHPHQPPFDDPIEARALETLREEQFNSTYNNEATWENIRNHLKEFAERVDENDLFVLYITTHGAPTFLELQRGPLLSSSVLQDWLEDVRPGVGLVYFDSCYSGDFIDRLSLPGYVLVSTTGSYLGWGDRYFSGGSYFFENLGDPEADANIDGQITIEEAFTLTDREAVEHRKRITPYLLHQYDWGSSDPIESSGEFSVRPTMIRGEKTDPNFSFVDLLRNEAE